MESDPVYVGSKFKNSCLLSNFMFFPNFIISVLQKPDGSGGTTTGKMGNAICLCFTHRINWFCVSNSFPIFAVVRFPSSTHTKRQTAGRHMIPTRLPHFKHVSNQWRRVSIPSPFPKAPSSPLSRRDKDYSKWGLSLNTSRHQQFWTDRWAFFVIGLL